MGTVDEDEHALPSIAWNSVLSETRDADEPPDVAEPVESALVVPPPPTFSLTLGRRPSGSDGPAAQRPASGGQAPDGARPTPSLSREPILIPTAATPPIVGPTPFQMTTSPSVASILDADDSSPDRSTGDDETPNPSAAPGEPTASQSSDLAAFVALSDTDPSDTPPSEPDTVQSDTVEPEPVEPETAEPDTAQPDTAEPGTMIVDDRARRTDAAGPEAPERPIEPDPVEASPTLEPASGSAPVDRPVRPGAEPAVTPVRHQPDQSTIPSLPAQATVPHRPAGSPHVTGPPAGVPRRAEGRTSSARIGFAILVLAIVASVAVIFGRPRLFPAQWDESIRPVADSIETVRRVDFTEPVAVVPLSAEEHHDLVTDGIIGDSLDDLPMWRAFGIPGPAGIDRATVGELAAPTSPVLYSTSDGQIYVDSSYVGSDRDARIMNALVVAALDQEFSIGAHADGASMDDRAMIDAHVRLQSDVVQQAAGEPVTVPAPDTAPFTFLPPVLDYRLTAPIVFSEMLAPFDDVASNPLADLDAPGPLRPPPVPPTPGMADGTTSVPAGEQRPMDRGFWFMVFASHLDSPTAYAMSNEIEAAGVEMISDPDEVCAVATFSVGDPVAFERLVSRLATWAATAAVEMTASSTVVGDSIAQLRSCDPGADHTSTAAFGIGHRLLAWRAAELAVTTAIVEKGGTAVDVDAAVGRIATSPAVIALVETSPGMPASDLATRARAAVADVVDPPPPTQP